MLSSSSWEIRGSVGPSENPRSESEMLLARNRVRLFGEKQRASHIGRPFSSGVILSVTAGIILPQWDENLG